VDNACCQGLRTFSELNFARSDAKVERRPAEFDARNGVSRLKSARWFALLLIASLPVRAQSIPGAVLAKHEPHHHLAYEDSDLRVLRVHVPPHDTTLLHEHDPDYFWIALGASEVVNARLGAPEARIRSSDLSIHYTAGKFAHVARNPGDSPFDNITVELLPQQTNVRNLCESAVADRPHDCPQAMAELTRRFRGASEHAAFTTDQLRVSLVTIQPGMAMQPSAEVKRAWVIALDTVDAGRTLRIEGSGRWVGGTFRPAPSAEWKVRNSGTTAVRVLAVVPLPPQAGR
jgi:hypothetical protein